MGVKLGQLECWSRRKRKGNERGEGKFKPNRKGKRKMKAGCIVRNRIDV
jgi:hypothetical protein